MKAARPAETQNFYVQFTFGAARQVVHKLFEGDHQAAEHMKAAKALGLFYRSRFPCSAAPTKSSNRSDVRYWHL
ncbi:MAG: hypothetical protein WA309_11195, partial [Pseudolabrys sp.]